MPVNIYIPDEQIDLLLDFYASELKGVKEKRTLLDKHEASIKSTIAQLRSKKYDIENNHTSNVPFAEKMRFQDDWTWAKKIEFAIGQARKAVTTNEIVDILSIYEPDFEGDGRKKAIASVSSTLSTKAGFLGEKDKDFVKIEDGTGRSKFSMQPDITEFQKPEPVEFQLPNFELENNLANFNTPVDDGLPF